MRAKKAALGGLLGIAPLLTPIGSTMAQEGLNASLTIGERLRNVSEEGFTTPQNEGTSAVTTLGFSLLSETVSQTLSLDLGTDIPIYADDNDNFNSSFVLEDPFARLAYTLDNRNSLLALTTSYRRSDVGTSNFFDETLDEDVVTGGGKRELSSARFALTLGREAPVTTDLSYTYLRSTFDQADPSTSDSTTNTLNGRVTFQLSPVASTFVFADWSEQDQDLATQSDRTTSSAGLGASYDISPVTRVTAQVSYDRDEDATRTNDGIGFQFGLRRDVSRGSIDFDASGTETINGLRQTVSVGRSYNLQRGSIFFSLGAVKEESAPVEPLANLRLSLDLTDTSRFNIGLNQSADVDDEDFNTIRTRLNVNYDLDINSLSFLSASLQLANDNRTGNGGGDDSRAVLASLTYNREITRDWDLVSGISYESDQNANSSDTKTRTVFVGIEKTFDFRP